MKKTLSFALALCAGMLAAGELRIDLDSMKSGVNLEIKETSPANFIVIDSPWYKEKQKQRFELRCETFDEWKPYSFTFVPAEDGIVTMLVMSKYHKKGETPFVSAYDKFEAQNITVRNGSFEETVPAHGWIPGWNTQSGLMIRQCRRRRILHDSLLRKKLLSEFQCQSGCPRDRFVHVQKCSLVNRRKD